MSRYAKADKAEKKKVQKVDIEQLDAKVSEKVEEAKKELL